MRAVVFVLVATTLLVVAQAFAHHGPNSTPDLYLAENLVELEGEIADVLWRNPHTRLRLKVLDANEQETIWELEMQGSVQGYRQQGIGPERFPVGSHVRAAGVVSRRDPTSMGLLHLLMPNGQELVTGARENRWSGENLATTQQEIDTGRVEAARRSATGVFRVWGAIPFAQGQIKASEYGNLLTERGQELANAYDRLTDDPQLECRQGMPVTMFDPTPMELRDQGDQIIILVHEYDIERVIHMDAEEREDRSPRSPLGSSVGRWDGDALVVTTTDVDWPLLTTIGTPQSNQVSYTERFAVSEGGNVLNYSLTIDDPVIFSEPFTVERTRPWTPAVEVEPYNCISQWSEGVNG
jgi:hypothetical protein